jgi:hypothetical protein
MCKAAALAVVVLVALGCSSARKYDVEANPSNFPPPPSGGHTWVFHSSPSFDADDPGKLRHYVSDALKKLGLPAVHSDGKRSAGDWGTWSEGLGEYQTVWSNFEWNDYHEGPLEVRTAAPAKDLKTSRVIFICVETKK